ncbi:MAG: MBL fold metallo-hydrolase [Anaerolineae bacterium]|nr:MBL fold metallo-hydrolase [Anaerolineae bacterium]
MRLSFLGGADEVGASSTLIEIGGLRLLVDAGIRVVAKTYKDIRADQLPDLHLIDHVGAPDYILITHVHTDHTGALPLVVQQFPYVPVLMTAPTMALLRVLQADAQRIMNMRQEQEGELPLYDAIATAKLLDAISVVEFNQPLYLKDSLRVTFHPAGHILGAAMIAIESAEESLLISGDISLTPQRAVGVAELPAIEPSVLIMESTYGGKLHPNRAAEEKRLIDSISRVIGRGGKVLIPTFALGRAQEVLQILLAHQPEVKVPIYADGMVRYVCEEFDKLREFLPPGTVQLADSAHLFFRDNVESVRDARQREEIVRSAQPAVIVASSGMLSGGPSSYYARHLMTGEANAIFLTGYQDEESPGRYLHMLTKDKSARANAVIEFDGEAVALRCELESYSISAHADEGELISVAERFAAADTLLVHGDEHARHSLAAKLRERGMAVHLPASGQIWQPAAPTVDSAKSSDSSGSSGSAIRVRIGSGVQLEQNRARQLALESFPDEARLRKVSMDARRKRMLLTFDFPDRVRQHYDLQLASLGESTGWKVEIHPQAIQQALEAVLLDVLPADCQIVRDPSIYPQYREVEVEVRGEVDAESAAQAYYAQTGYRLLIRRSKEDASTTLIDAFKFIAQPHGTEPLEINTAYRLIRDTLEPCGLLRTSLRQGQIVLTFISPQIGVQHQQEIARLADETGYPLSIHPYPDQNAILRVVQQSIRSAGWTVRKGPGLHIDRGEITVVLSPQGVPQIDEQTSIAQIVEAKTGYHLSVKVEENRY